MSENPIKLYEPINTLKRITSIFRGGVRCTDPNQAEFPRYTRSVRRTSPLYCADTWYLENGVEELKRAFRWLA